MTERLDYGPQIIISLCVSLPAIIPTWTYVTVVLVSYYFLAVKVYFVPQVVQFHPNSNYVATGSSDRSLRLWDCVTGSCVRLMTGHKVKGNF
jgi:WD40 repeat protein